MITARMHHLAAGQSQDPSTWIAILLGGMVLVYLSVLRPMMRKREDPLERPPARTGLAQQRAVERDMQQVMVEYEKMVRSMTAGVDTRAARLEQLLREADEKIAAMRATISALQSTNSTTTPPSPAAFGPLFVPPGPENSADPRVAEVYALADQGLSIRDVARRVGIPHGEIELMLNLRGGTSKRPTAAN